MELVKINMAYKDYKKHFADCGNCGDYNTNGKCITVLIPKDRWEEHLKKAGNYGNRYQFHDYEFLILEPGYKEPWIIRFTAKSKANAVKQMQKFLKERNATLIEDLCKNEE